MRNSFFSRTRMHSVIGACALLVAAAAAPACSSDPQNESAPPVEGPGDVADGGDAGEDIDAGEPPNPELDAACTPKVVIQLEDTGPNGELFTKTVPEPEAFVQEVGRHVCRILYRKPSEVRAANKITLILREDETPGWKSGDVGDITVMVSTSHLADVEAAGDDVKTELEGVLTHEMTHMYQNDDKAPGEGTYENLGNVIEGIADAVRIRAKLPPPGSKPTKSGSWDDAGYWKPAFFLLWIDGQYPDFLYRLNQSMAMGDGKAWTPAEIETITGRSVDDLWAAYASATCCSGSNNRSCCQ
jgi:Peptidase of plants and bacteria